VVCFFFFFSIHRLLLPCNFWKTKLCLFASSSNYFVDCHEMYRRYSLHSRFSACRDQFLDRHLISNGGRNFGLRGHGNHVFYYPTSRHGGSGFYATRHGGSGFDANLGGGSAFMPLWIIVTSIILSIGMVVLALMPLGAVVLASMPIWVVVLASMAM
jgi:hypothetical protein